MYVGICRHILNFEYLSFSTMKCHIFQCISAVQYRPSNYVPEEKKKCIGVALISRNLCYMKKYVFDGVLDRNSSQSVRVLFAVGAP